MAKNQFEKYSFYFMNRPNGSFIWPYLYCFINLGGPLVCNVDGKAILTGVVSWGFVKCGTNPSVFARVTHVLSWIKDNLVIVCLWQGTDRLFRENIIYKYLTLRIVYHQPKTLHVEYHNLLVMAYVMIQITMLDATLMMEIAVHLIMLTGISEW